MTTTPRDPLLPHHRHELEVGSGIDPAIVASRGYRSVTAQEAAALGFAAYQALPGLLMPQWTLAGAQVGALLKPDAPRVTSDGKPQKYEAIEGQPAHLDIHPDAQPLLRDPSVALDFTEGNKKSDADWSHGRLCISLRGVFMFLRGRLVVPDLDEIALSGRRCRVIFDSDVTRKPEVAEALLRFCAALHRRGAIVEVASLPEGPDGAKVGLDDWYVADHTANELEALVVPWDGAGPGVWLRAPDDACPDQLAARDARIVALEDQLAAAGAELARLRAANAAHHAPNLGPERHTAVALAGLLDAMPEGFTDGMPYGTIAAAAGVSEATAVRHLGRLGIDPATRDAGIWTGLVEVCQYPLPPRRDPTTGRTHTPMMSHMRRIAPTVELFTRISTAPVPADGVRHLHGGKPDRKPCPQCGSHRERRRRVVEECLDCGAMVALSGSLVRANPASPHQKRDEKHHAFYLDGDPGRDEKHHAFDLGGDSGSGAAPREGDEKHDAFSLQRDPPIDEKHDAFDRAGHVSGDGKQLESPYLVEGTQDEKHDAFHPPPESQPALLTLPTDHRPAWTHRGMRDAYVRVPSDGPPPARATDCATCGLFWGSGRIAERHCQRCGRCLRQSRGGVLCLPCVAAPDPDLGDTAPPLIDAQDTLIAASRGDPATMKRATADVGAQLTRHALANGRTPVPKPGVAEASPDPWAAPRPGLGSTYVEAGD